jgi:hypothetical protein
MQCAPCSVAVSHQYAAVVTEKGLRVDLAAARLIVEKHDWFFTVLADRGTVLEPEDLSVRQEQIRRVQGQVQAP